MSADANMNVKLESSQAEAVQGTSEDGSKKQDAHHRFSVENQRAYRERITTLHDRLDAMVPKPRGVKRRKKRSRIQVLEDLRVLLKAIYSDDKVRMPLHCL
eukprot:208167-Rhodomonas_salina.1